MRMILRNTNVLSESDYEFFRNFATNRRTFSKLGQQPAPFSFCKWAPGAPGEAAARRRGAPRPGRRGGGPRPAD